MTKTYKDEALDRLTEKMVRLRKEKPGKGRTLRDIRLDMIDNIFLTSNHLKTKYPGNKEAKAWIKENDRLAEELMGRG